MMIDTETIYLENLCYLYVPCNFLFCYYRCCFQLGNKAAVLSSGGLPALFFKALVGRRPCEPSQQTIPTVSTLFENIFWALTNLKSDSQLEV